MLQDAATRSPEHAGAVAVVDIKQRVPPLRQTQQLGDRCNVAVLAKFACFRQKRCVAFELDQRLRQTDE